MFLKEPGFQTFDRKSRVTNMLLRNQISNKKLQTQADSR